MQVGGPKRAAGTRRWDTRTGTIELKTPKVTAGAYFPSLLEPRRRAEKALHAVVVEAYVKGVSTRKVDDLVRPLGCDGISRSEVSRICKSLDEQARAFLSRPIEADCPTGSSGVLLETVPSERIVTALIVRSEIGIAGYLIGPLVGGLIAQNRGFDALWTVPATAGFITILFLAWAGSLVPRVPS